MDYRDRYLDFLQQKAAQLPIGDDVRFAVDCSNGMASLLVHELFPQATVINDTLDGRFPNHSPNPLKSDAREQIASLVRDRGLDCGLIFDGDADRVMLVDENGLFVQPDYLIPVVARACRASGGVGSVVLHDVRTSRGAIEALREDGFEPVMVPVGHAFAKPVMRERAALCGGELAGHYYFSDFFNCDSGILAALRILGEFSRWRKAADAAHRSFSAMMAPIFTRYVNSGELNFRVEDKDAAIARVMSLVGKRLPTEVSRSEMDGIRVEFADGWFNIRKSNTEPYLRLLVEARTAAMMDDWVEMISERINNG